MGRDETRQYLKNWQGEMDGAEIYRQMSAVEKDEKIAGLYGRLAETETKHAVRWEEKLQTQQVSVPPYRPTWQTRVLRWFILRVGPDLVLPTLHSQEQRTSKDYRKQQAGDDMAADERSHAILLQQLVQTSKGMEGSTLARIEGRHRGAGGNALRAAVLGASDGLISNYNLIMGVAGAAMSSSNILLTGLAGLLAGAISMAMGEWISVQSSRELFEKQLATEKEEIETAPGRGDRGACPDLPGPRPERIDGADHGHPDHERQGTCPGDPGPGRAGHRPRRAGRVGMGGGDCLLPLFRHRGRHPGGALSLSRGHAGDGDKRRLRRRRPFPDRRGHHTLHGPVGPSLGAPPDSFRRRLGPGHLRCRSPDRRQHQLKNSGMKCGKVLT